MLDWFMLSECAEGLVNFDSGRSQGLQTLYNKDNNLDCVTCDFSYKYDYISFSYQ